MRLLKKRAVSSGGYSMRSRPSRSLASSAGIIWTRRRGAAARGRVLLHAPDQVVHQRAVAIGIVRAVGAAELGLGHHLGPGALEEIADEIGDVQPFDRLPELDGQLLGQQVALLGVQQGARGLLAAVHAATWSWSTHWVCRWSISSPKVSASITLLPSQRTASSTVSRKRRQPGSLSVVKARLRWVMRSRNWRAGWVRSLKKRESCCASFSTAGSMALSWRLNSGQQPLVLRQVVEHQPDHFLAELQAQPRRRIGRAGGGFGQHVRRRRGRRRLGPLLQLLHQRVDLLHVLQHRHRRRHGVEEVRTRRLRIEVAGQQLAQAVQRQQRLGHRVGHRRAARAAALLQPAAERHGRLHAAGAQPVGQLAVELAQVDAEQPGGRRDQDFAHRRVGHVLRPGRTAARARTRRAAAG